MNRTKSFLNLFVLFLIGILVLGCASNQSSAPQTVSNAVAQSPSTQSQSSSGEANVATSDGSGSSVSQAGSSGSARWSGWPWGVLPSTALKSSDFSYPDAFNVYQEAAPQVTIQRSHFSLTKPSSWLSQYGGEDFDASATDSQNKPADNNASLTYVRLYPVDLVLPIDGNLASAKPETLEHTLNVSQVSMDLMDSAGYYNLTGGNSPQSILMAFSSRQKHYYDLPLIHATHDPLTGDEYTNYSSSDLHVIKQGALTVSGFPAYEIETQLVSPNPLTNANAIADDILVVSGPNSPGLYIEMYYVPNGEYTLDNVNSDFQKMVQSIQLKP